MALREDIKYLILNGVFSGMSPTTITLSILALPSLVELDEDQELPEIDPHELNCNEGCLDPYIAQQAMWRAGFRRVKPR